jgi:hypothetical protein
MKLYMSSYSHVKTMLLLTDNMLNLFSSTKFQEGNEELRVVSRLELSYNKQYKSVGCIYIYNGKIKVLTCKIDS